ncbi:hypothetical protein [Micromonospora parathelypteridis]|uniref:Lipoprotein n=1 Tax=Micromonospora parathelypteridis TaxID=1839617 RepID=A0A840VX55_9ACTN|nr:hypothetical protein [Micromonospora parathelypteridis]MBB5481315.1 hypothetical protein [Micromonospora parathelypteridis]GGO19094.1 hypothetical protein GCM10011576_34810 [Micromonospora parathelypteridis]
MVRKWMLVGLLALLAGCDSGGNAVPEPAPADPLAQVRAAAAKTAKGSAHVTLSVPNVEVVGDTDPAGKALTLTVTTGTGGETVDSKVRVVGDDAWMTLGSTYLPNLDPTKFIWFPTSEFATASLVHLGDTFDPAGIKGFSAAMTAATRTGEGTYTGTLDFTVAPAKVSRGLLPATAEQLEHHGGVSQSVPYEASVDAQGYLIALTVTLPTFASTARFSDFGKHVKIDKPSAAEVTEVPDGLRRLLAS